MTGDIAPVPGIEELRGAIEAAARAAHGDVDVGAITVLPGGHSGLTLRVAVEGPGLPDEVVVKATPPGRRPTGRHDVLRQARIVEALDARGEVPVASVVFKAAEPVALFATVLADGVAVDPILESGPLDDPDTVAAAWAAATDVLVRLHATPLDALGLADEPAREPGAELEIWAATIAAAKLEDDRRARQLLDALAAEVPQSGRTAVVHGDYRLGNILMAGSSPQAVIDWEIWSVGDPAVDIGWFAQFTDATNYPGVGRDVPGTPTRDELLARYCAGAGEDRARLDWFLALGCLKLAAIQAHNRRRHLDGRYHDPYQELLGPSIDRLLESGLELAG